MNAKPFSWVVRLTVDSTWVADGFSMSDERAQRMLASEVGGAMNSELSAVVLEAPAPHEIANVQGYSAPHYRRDAVCDALRDGCPHDGTIYRALRTAKKLLDSVAFVAKEGDTADAIANINAALAAIDARQPIEVQA